MGSPIGSNEAAPYYFTYINRVATENIVQYLDVQLEEMLVFLKAIPEEASLHRYEPEKWSLRQC
jgi:hypothetical protein